MSTVNTAGSRTFPFNKNITSHWETMCSRILLLKPIVFFQEIHVFLQVNSIGLLVTKGAYLHLEKAKLQEVYVPKLTHFSQGTHVLDTAACNTFGLLFSDTCISSTEMNRPISNKEREHPPRNIQVSGAFAFKNYLNSHREQCVQCSKS
jgi:hypothetical protein